MEFVIISGLSGAGKSKAASFMEDMDYFCVDNLPAPLIPKFAELGMAGSGEYDRVALVTDVRAGTNFDGLFHALDALEADHDYLTAGGVFPEELINNWIKLKRKEVEEISRIPTPAEFQRYYTL